MDRGPGVLTKTRPIRSSVAACTTLKDRGHGPCTHSMTDPASVYLVRKKDDEYGFFDVAVADNWALAAAIARALDEGVLPSEVVNRSDDDGSDSVDSYQGSSSPGYNRFCRQEAREARQQYVVRCVPLVTDETLASFERSWKPTELVTAQREEESRGRKDDEDEVRSFLKFWDGCGDEEMKAQRFRFSRHVIKRHAEHTNDACVRDWVNVNRALFD